MTVKTAFYATDFNQWLEEHAFALQQGRFADLDIESLVQNIESLARSVWCSVASNLTVTLMHLLKYQYQPDHRSRNWRLTLREYRCRIGSVLAESPSLRPYVTGVLETCFQDAS